MTFSRAFGLSLLSCFAVGCNKSDSAGPAPAPSASAADLAPAPKAAPPADAGLAPLPPTAMMSIPERFANEHQNRPTGVPKVEDVVAAFEKAGAKVHDQKQHLAAPFLAKYCVGSQTGEDIHLSICEYDNAAMAMKGVAESAKLFGSVANRTVHQNGGTSLTVRLGKNGPEDQTLAKKLIETFKKVPAPAKTP